MSRLVRVGLLALQGDYAAHGRALAAAAAAAGLSPEITEVRRPSQLDGLDGLVLPGGESTTLLKLLAEEDLGLAIRRWATEQGGSLFATCAGAILVSRSVLRPVQESFGLLDAVIERNAYGRQVDSFVDRLTPPPGSPLGAEPVEAVFIRAPRFRSVGPAVAVLLSRGDEPVLVREGRVLAGTFHPELTAQTRIHGYFLRMLQDGKGVAR